MSYIVVKFKNRVDADVRTEQAVPFICHLFGYSSPWFNDDAWLEDDNRTLVLGSGYSTVNVAGYISAVRAMYEGEIIDMYEEADE